MSFGQQTFKFVVIENKDIISIAGTYIGRYLRCCNWTSAISSSTNRGSIRSSPYWEITLTPWEKVRFYSYQHPSKSGIILTVLPGTDKLYVRYNPIIPRSLPITETACPDHSQRVGFRRCILRERWFWDEVKHLKCRFQTPAFQFLRHLVAAICASGLHRRRHNLRHH